MNFYRTSNLFSFGKIILNLARSSRPEVFCKKGVLRNFTISFEISRSTFFYRTPPVAASALFCIFEY